MTANLSIVTYQQESELYMPLHFVLSEISMHVFVSQGYLKESIPSYTLQLLKHTTRHKHK